MHTDAKRYYAVLGVDPIASEEVIRGAFRRRAKELHPDAQSGNASAFILLKRAYDTLMNPLDRAAYDRACQPPQRPPPPRPQPRDPHQPQARRTTSRPLPTRSKPSRRGGVGAVRYVIAFLIMAAISLGGVQAMISLTGAPPSIQTRGDTSARAEAGTSSGSESAPASAAESSNGPGSSKSGFWEVAPAAPAKKTSY